MGHHQHKPGQLLLETIEDNKQPEKKIEGVKDKEGEVNDTFVKCFREYTTKEILKEVSLYFNPGSMIGLMGPSGCGKTTFLDILTGRRETGKFGVIYMPPRKSCIAIIVLFLIGQYLCQWLST